MSTGATTPARRGQQPPRLGRYHARWHRVLRFIAQRLVLRPVVSAVTSTTVEGTDNVEGLSGPFILVANHCSHLDTAVVISQLPYRLTKQLTVGAAADYFYARWWTKAATSLFFNTYPIHRGRSSGKGKGLSQQLLRSGLPIMIFPEGTRSRDGVMRTFKPGAAMLSATTGLPCLPVALLGTYEAMPVGRFWPVPGRPRVRVLVGRPMRPHSGESVREFNTRLADRIRTMMTMQTPYVVGDSRRGGQAGRSQEEAS
ncbi:lysophospholipid acyltransferase family protein [uncultured Georgenia sp.]|uniref:lysophospholipid acyltransferase family protein n=1 Tax=uncultured Georgenia sp. TaxID=378209 RepID=UPI002628AC4E|nr:lysophospholipid acyltransferase family protein [uncultured Georgenia sp.]HLV05129.1 lysophospholipid acyltransferase family protein [Actinomycetaceae bacterium]